MGYVDSDKILRKMQKIATEAWKMNIVAKVEMIWNEAMDVIRFAPSADVAPVVHGHWEDINGNPVPWSERVAHCPAYSAHCSECRQWLVASDEYMVLGNYCPNCGAKMDGDIE